MLQNELDQIVKEWDVHKIRKTKNAVSPSGRPYVMFRFPEIYGCEDYLLEANLDDIRACREECTFLNTTCDTDAHELCEIILLERNMNKPEVPNEAVNMYLLLRTEINSLL